MTISRIGSTNFTTKTSTSPSIIHLQISVRLCYVDMIDLAVSNWPATSGSVWQIEVCTKFVFEKTRLKNRYYWQFNTNGQMDGFILCCLLIGYLWIFTISRCHRLKLLSRKRRLFIFYIIMFISSLLIRDRVRQDKIQKTPLSDLHRSCRQSSTNIIRVQWYLSIIFLILSIVLNFGCIEVYLYSSNHY